MSATLLTGKWRQRLLGCRFGYHRYVYAGEHTEVMRFGWAGWNHRCERCERTVWMAAGNDDPSA